MQKEPFIIKAPVITTANDKVWISENMSVFWYQVYQARLPERLLTLRGMPSDSTCILEAEPGKLDIKRREPGILFISLQVDSLFKLAIMMSLSRFVLIQRHWRRHS